MTTAASIETAYLAATDPIGRLRIAFETAEAVYIEARNAADAARHRMDLADAALLAATGQAGSLRGLWLAAHLRGDHAECTRILGLQYPQDAEVHRPPTPEEVEARRAEAAVETGRAA